MSCEVCRNAHKVPDILTFTQGRYAVMGMLQEPTEYYITTGPHPHTRFIINYCPMCGRRLVSE